MSWTERQRRMLAEMGLPVWASPAIDAPGGAAVAMTPAAPVAHEPGTEAAAPQPPALGAERLRDVPLGNAGTAPVSQAASRPPVATPRDPGQRATGPAGPPAPRGEPPLGARPVADMRSAEIATMGWAALRDAVAACRACGLCDSRRQTVFGVGHERAHLMVVGEAPGEQEDRQGEPFVGAAGQLLDRMLAALGLTRAPEAPERQVFIANTLKCRPPGNRNPEPVELAQCEPFLQRQLALVQPRVILAMGRFAVQALLRSNEPIGRLRGRVHRYQGVPLVVTYHPAYLLRNLPDKAKAWDDLCLAASVLEGPGRAA